MNGYILFRLYVYFKKIRHKVGGLEMKYRAIFLVMLFVLIHMMYGDRSKLAICHVLWTINVLGKWEK